MSLRRHNPPAVHAPLGEDHHATVDPLGNGLKRLVHGGAGRHQAGRHAAGDPAAQIEQAYDNLLAMLASEGMGRGSGEDHLLHHRHSPEGLTLSREIRARKLGDVNPVLDLSGDRRPRGAGPEGRDRGRGGRQGVASALRATAAAARWRSARAPDVPRRARRKSGAAA